jgi:uncharacterized protein (TIGR02246 family)
VIHIPSFKLNECTIRSHKRKFLRSIDMHYLSKLVVIFAFFGICSNTGFALEPADHTAIEKIVQDLTDAWNLKEGHGFADNYTEDADFVNIYGKHFSGRNEIEKRHVNILQTFMKGSNLSVTNVRLREIKPGIVVALVNWKLEGYRHPRARINSTGMVREGIFTHVLANTNNKWEIIASHNTVTQRVKCCPEKQ